MTNLFTLTLIIWVGSEIALAFFKRSKDVSKRRDHASLRILWLTISISISLAFFLSSLPNINQLSLFIGANVIGTSVIILGVLFRWIAIFQLRHYFTVDVAISANHQLVKTGLYRYLRHPSYTGSLVSFLGLGISLNNWIGFIVVLLPIVLAFLYRVSIEEFELSKALGNQYENYKKLTSKLIPGVY